MIAADFGNLSFWGSRKQLSGPIAATVLMAEEFRDFKNGGGWE